MTYAKWFLIGLFIMSAALVRPNLAFARGLDLSNEQDVRRAVASYADINGRTFDRYHFDEDAAARAVLFFPQYCRMTKGSKFAGRPLVLTDWQAFDIIVPVFGWKCEDGTRRYRRATVWVPRKNGKTELLGGVSLIHLIGDGEYGGEGYAVATKEDQARIVFDVARRMVLLNPDLSQHVTVFADSLYCGELFSVFKPLGGKAEGSHGKGPSFRIADEVHEFKDDRLLQFLDQGTGARQQPMAWDISTAGLQQGYGWELWNVCRNLVEGAIIDHRTLVAIYAAREDDDPYDPATWARANPNLGVSLTHDYMRDQAELARRSSRHENDFKRYHLNQWVGQVTRWIQMERWNQCSADQPQDAWKTAFDELRGRTGYMGVDLASTRDLCSEIIVFPPGGGDVKWRVLVRLWLPGADLESRIRDERVPYDMWEEQGAIVLTAGDAADHAAIERQIREDVQTYDIKKIGFDPWNAHGLMTSINADYPELAVKVAQTIAGMSGASKLLERLVLTAMLDHGNHPILRWMASNVATVSDGNGNIKPAKDKSTQKIDGIVATIIALALTQGADENAGQVPNIDAMVTL